MIFLTASLSFYTLQIFVMGLHLQMLVIGGIITVSCKQGEQFLLGVRPSLRPVVGGLQKRAQ